MEKLIWKLKFRLKQAKGFCKLCEYNFRHRFGLEGDDGFYYYLQRRLMEDLIKADPEQEYLEEHGLLPDEPEPEPMSESEPEKEPGLVRELDFLDLIVCSITLNHDTYHATSVKEYEDRTVITMQIVDGSTFDIREEVIQTPHKDGQRYDPFTLDEENWRWDHVDAKLRFCPVVQETAEELAIAQPVRMLQGLALRVDKDYAEEKLSPTCLEYAFACSEAGYDWCVTDHSYCTAAYELRLAVGKDALDDILEGIERYCYHYRQKNERS